MNIAAGVLLIIAALFNGCGGSIYALGGAGAAGAAAIGEEAQKEAALQGGADEEATAQLAQATDEARAAGGTLMFYGFFLFVMLGLQIAGGVVLFMKKAGTFILVVGVLGIIAEAAGFGVRSSVGIPTEVTVGNIIGFLASALAIVGALQIKKAQAGSSAA